jgi:hypothetical protein
MILTDKEVAIEMQRVRPTFGCRDQLLPHLSSLVKLLWNDLPVQLVPHAGKRVFSWQSLNTWPVASRPGPVLSEVNMDSSLPMRGGDIRTYIDGYHPGLIFVGPQSSAI